MIRSMNRRYVFCLISGLLLQAAALAQPATQSAVPDSDAATQPADAWQAELDTLDQPITLPAPRGSDSRSFTRHLGGAVPRSLITLNAIQLPDGEKNAFSSAFDGSASEYAAHVMSLRIDQLFEQVRGPQAVELAQRLGGGRMKFGVSRATPPMPPLSFLPRWLTPLPPVDLHPDVARDMQLIAQRLDDAGNFAGFVITGAQRHTAAYLSDRLQEIAPEWIVTPGDFDGTNHQISGEGLFSHLAVQQVRPARDPSAVPPLSDLALIDRLRSYHPHKQTWAIIDSTDPALTRRDLHRAYALALTRGIDAIGVNHLPLPGGPAAEQRIADLREIHEWVQRLGGVYGMTEPIPTIGVLYVHSQALRDREHAALTLHAMVVCHAGGYSARVITPEELQRGLPDAMKAVLLVGLGRADEQQVWHHGLEDALRKYVEQGGRFIIDETSVAPVPAIKPGLKISVADEPADAQAIIESNQRNIAHLREAMSDTPRPIGYSDDPFVWAIPSLAGNVEYVTVVSIHSTPTTDQTPQPAATTEPVAPAEPAPPMVGTLAWSSSRPVYDVRTRRKLSAEEARSVDLTTEGFHLFALPPVEPPPPAIHVEVDGTGCFIARIETGEVRGLPIEVMISRDTAAEKIYRATGEPFRLPLQIYDEPGEYDIAVTELVTGQTGQTRVVVPANAPPRKQEATSDHLAKFAARKDQPLVIALTEAQMADTEIAALAARLEAHFRAVGREVRIAPASPRGEDAVVLLADPPADAPRPRWRTRDVDLVLLGTPRDNVLIRDQALGRLLPPRIESPETRVTWAPFAPDRQVLNLLGDGVAALTVLVEQVERDAR